MFHRIIHILCISRQLQIALTRYVLPALNCLRISQLGTVYRILRLFLLHFGHIILALHFILQGLCLLNGSGCRSHCLIRCRDRRIHSQIHGLLIVCIPDLRCFTEFSCLLRIGHRRHQVGIRTVIDTFHIGIILASCRRDIGRCILLCHIHRSLLQRDLFFNRLGIQHTEQIAGLHMIPFLYQHILYRKVQA